jgi:hypothetical protein
LINHLLVNCRFSIRFWVFIKDWMDLHPLDLQQWSMLSFKAWRWRCQYLLLTGRSWHPLPCLFLGRFGTK